MDIIREEPSIITSVITQEKWLQSTKRDLGIVKHLAVYIFVLQACGSLFHCYLHSVVLKVLHTAGP